MSTSIIVIFLIIHILMLNMTKRNYFICVFIFIFCFSGNIVAQIKLVDARGTLRDTAILLSGRVKYTDTASMLSPYLRKLDSIKTSPFYLVGGTVDAGSNKTGSIYRTGEIAASSAVFGSYNNVNSAPTNGLIVSGNVGIGTTSPYNKLDVVGGLNIRNIAGNWGTGYGIELNTSANSPRIDWVYNGAYVGQFSSDANNFILQNSKQGTGGFAFITNVSGTGTEKVRISNNGNVGIGITSPVTTLHLQNPLLATDNINADAQILRLSRLQTSGVKWDNVAQFNLGSYQVESTNKSAKSRLDLAMNDAGSLATSNIMTWQANGKVGINTTAPSYHLDVVGRGRFSDSLLGTTAQFNALTTGSTNDSIVTIDASGNLKKRSATLLVDTNSLNKIYWSLNGNALTTQKILGTTTNFDLPLYTNNIERVRIKTNGNVGIGTSAPASILHVESTENANYTSVGRFLAPNNTSAGNATQINFGTVMSAGNNAEWRFIYQGNNSTTNRVDFGMNGYTAPIISYLVNGRVGIGNGSPSTKLDVVGTGKFSDTLYGTKAVFSSLSSGATTDSVVTIDANGVLKRINQSLFTTPVSATVSGIVNNTALQELGGVDKKINGIIIGNGGGNSYLNLRVGYGAFNANTTGTSNTALGTYALAAATSGSGNTSLGSTSLNSNTSGSNNTAVGQYAGRYLTTGSNNTFIGQSAGNNITTGSYNISIGNSNLVSGNNNTIIGGTSTSINIGANTKNNIIALGNGIGAIRLYADSIGNVGIGNTAPNNKLELTHGTAGNSGLRLTNLPNSTTAKSASAVNQKYLSVDANGDVVLAAAADAIISVTGLASGLTSPVTAATFQAGSFENSYSKTDSTVIYVNQTDGTQWVYSAASGGVYKSYAAPASTEWYTSGSTTDAGSNKTGAIYRTGNVGINTNAPSQKFDVNGTALFRNGNTSNAFTSNQVLFGYSTTNNYMHAIKTRHNNAASLGNAIDFYVWQTTDALTSVGSKHGMTIDATGVGIGGITAPVTTLHVNNPLAATNTVNANAQVLRLSRPSVVNVKWDNISQFNLGSYAVAGASTNEAYTRLDLAMNDGPNTTTSNIMTWTANGRVGIGTTAPGYPLHIYSAAPSSIYVESTTADNNGMMILNANTASNWSSNWHEFLMFKNQGTLIGSVINNGTAAVSYSTTSDQRLKENIQPTSFSIADLKKIEIKDFTYKSDKGTYPQTGVMAQQLYKVIPSVVTVGGADATKNPWQVDYGKLTPYLIKAVQDQQQQIEQLQEKSKNQTDQMNEIKLQNQQLLNLINQLEKRIQSLEKN